MRLLRYAVPIFLVASNVICAREPASEDLVMLGPSGPVAAQVGYLVHTWPEQHAVAIIEVTEVPHCWTSKNDNGLSSSVTYCFVQARPVEFLLVRWLNPSPPGPGNAFTLHYWTTQPISGAPPSIRVGSKVIALLAPVHAARVYSATVIKPATEQTIQATREALRGRLREGA